MTLTSVLTKLSFSGNGSTTAFAVSFVYYDDDGLRVILVDDTTGVETVQSLTTQYTLSGGNGATGTLTMLTAPATGETLIIKSNISDTQETDFPTGGNLRSTSIEEQMDILTRLVQQKEEQISRMMILKESTTLSDLTFPDPTALGIIRWNVAATALETIVGFSTGTFIEDTDSDTKIQVEETSDEDIIRFDVATVEIATMSATSITFGLPVDITGAVTVSSTVDGRDLATDGTKLDTIESSADVTDATNVNAAGAVMESDFANGSLQIRNQAGVMTNITVADNTILGRDFTTGDNDIQGLTPTEVRQLLQVEVLSTADQTGAEIKALYEAETSAFTDTQFTKLAGIETVADVTDYTNVIAALAAPDATFVFNEASGDFDARFEGLSNTHLLFLDAGNNRIGISNVSLTSTDGLLHIQSGTAGAVTASTSADHLVLEGSGNAGLTILSPSADFGFVNFGSPVSNTRGQIGYNHSADVLFFNTSSADSLQLSQVNGAVFNDAGTATLDFRVEGDTATHLLFIDAGTQNVIINGSVSATSSLGHLHINNGTSPTAVLANGIVLGSKDSATGSLLAVPELWIENPPEVIGTFTASHKFKIWINGTEYFIQLDAV